MNSKNRRLRSASILQALTPIFVLLLTMANAPGAIAQVDTFKFESPSNSSDFVSCPTTFAAPCVRTRILPDLPAASPKICAARFTE